MEIRSYQPDIEYESGKGISFSNLEREPEKWGRIRREVLELPQNIEGLNVERISGFMSSLGMESKPLVFLDRETIPSLAAIYEKYNYDISVDDFGMEGFYEPHSNLVIVFRDKVREKLNGFIATEGIAVHELFHGSTHYRGIVNEEGDNFRARVGHAVNGGEGFGDFFEEGGADYYRHQYLHQYMAIDDYRRLLNVYDDKIHPQEDIEQQVNSYSVPYFKQERVPLLYGMSRSTHKVEAAIPSLAGYAMNLLIELDPDIEGTIVEARKSVSGLRAFAQRIEQLQSGLYVQLRSLKYDPDDFIKGFQVIARLPKNN